MQNHSRPAKYCTLSHLPQNAHFVKCFIRFSSVPYFSSVIFWNLNIFFLHDNFIWTFATFIPFGMFVNYPISSLREFQNYMPCFPLLTPCTKYLGSVWFWRVIIPRICHNTINQECIQKSFYNEKKESVRVCNNYPSIRTTDNTTTGCIVKILLCPTMKLCCL